MKVIKDVDAEEKVEEMQDFAFKSLRVKTDCKKKSSKNEESELEDLRKGKAVTDVRKGYH